MDATQQQQGLGFGEIDSHLQNRWILEDVISPSGLPKTYRWQHCCHFDFIPMQNGTTFTRQLRCAWVTGYDIHLSLFIIWLSVCKSSELWICPPQFGTQTICSLPDIHIVLGFGCLIDYSNRWKMYSRIAFLRDRIRKYV